MVKNKKNLINYYPFIVFLISGIIDFIAVRIMTYLMVGAFYYDDYTRTILDKCNSGIAPCDITTWFVEPLSSIIGSLIGITVIIFYLLKNKIKRKWFILVFGILTQFCLFLIIPYIAKPMLPGWVESPLFYLTAFGIQYLIFNLFLK